MKTFMARLSYISDKEVERYLSKTQKPKRKERIDNYSRALSDRVKKGQI
ncbi:hypothetical protein [Planococcus dechangensis]|uniref:Uncharacterized protein n=1 Tax=Planococcus dechangensis TaxID=1176255 RepID=A0ABV9M9N8_9BACL